MQGGRFGERVAGSGIGAQNRLHDETVPKYYGDFAYHRAGGRALCAQHTACSNRPDTIIQGELQKPARAMPKSARSSAMLLYKGDLLNSLLPSNIYIVQ